MSKKFYTIFLVIIFSLSALVAAGKKEAPQRKVIFDDSKTVEVQSNKLSVNLNPTMEKAAVGTRTRIGDTYYDVGWNSGSPNRMVYFNGKTYMVFIAKPTASGKREITYVYYNGTAFTLGQPVISGATQETYFSGIDVFRGGDAKGFAAVGAGWAGSGKSYFGLESGAGLGNFSTSVASNDRDVDIVILDTVGTVLWKDTKGRTDYKILRSSDYGTSWAAQESTVIANGKVPGKQIQSTLDASVFKFPDGSVGIGCTIGTSVYADGNLLPAGDVPTASKDTANLVGYFKSTDKGKTWKWTTAGYCGAAMVEPDMYNFLSNFDQQDWLADKNGKVHMVANGYPYYYKVSGTDTISRNSAGVVYWDEVNGFKKLHSFDSKDTMVSKSLVIRSYNSYGCSYPSIAQSDDGLVLVATWSQPSWTGTVLDTLPGNIMQYDIWYNYSVNGGATWATAQNLTATKGFGEHYGNMAQNLEKVNATTYKARMSYMTDSIGAVGVTTGNPVGYFYHEWTVTTTGVQPQAVGTVNTFSLDQNYPNPFNPSTTINFSLPTSGNTMLKVYNTLGQEVATLVNEFVNAGSYSVPFNASKLSSGVYLYKLQSGNYTSTKKMVLTK